MSWDENLAKEIAKGIIETGIEGAYDSVAKSTAYSYPSIGVSQWEGDRANNLLRMIPGGEEFVNRNYVNIQASGELPMLRELLRSEAGQQAQLELCYVWWKADEIANALAACDRFLKLHPNHPNADYIYYLKGLINFKEDLGFVAYLGSSDPSERDSDASKEALNSFAELLRRYPNSKYAPDAQKRVLYLVNALAQKEIHVAKYYIKRQAFLAAANRAQQVLKDFPNTPSNEEALYIMVVAYKELGLRQLHDDTLRIMQQNFPDSKYFKEGLFADKKWWHLW